jgi:hypothetical protein
MPLASQAGPVLTQSCRGQPRRAQLRSLQMTETPMAPTNNPWPTLENHCAAALAVSRDLLSRLEAGADAAELVPLLRKEQVAVEGVHSQIALFGGRLPADGADRRDAVAENLMELMRLDGLSRDLLSKRGVRLRSPRRRHTPRRQV